MGKRTACYNRPTEALATTISDNCQVYVTQSTEGSLEVIDADNDTWVATLTDYHRKTAKLEEPFGSAEAGELWTKLGFTDASPGIHSNYTGNKEKGAREAISNWKVSP